jgi:two-component system, NtrC family, sensor histidine kinase KinB
MKTSIRNNRFGAGLLLYLAIILILTLTSSYYIHDLSNKTNAIHSENHTSVTYSRKMCNALTSIHNNYLLSGILGIKMDHAALLVQADTFLNNLSKEQRNITETGEADLVNKIAVEFNGYKNTLADDNVNDANVCQSLQQQYLQLNNNLMQLSVLNEHAIETKTANARKAAGSATFNMSIIGAVCLLLAFVFSFVFTSYFNDRFYQFYKGVISMTIESNYQRLYFEGSDEFNQMSVIINGMADKIEDKDMSDNKKFIDPN